MPVTKSKTNYKSDQPKILIISSDYDHILVHRVIEYLHNQNAQVIYFKSEDLISSDNNFYFEVNESKSTLIYDGVELDLGAINAVWYRRPHIFFKEKAKNINQTEISKESMSISSLIWGIIDDDKFLNSTNRIKYSDNKFRQLIIASKLGFITPVSLVSNNGNKIKEFASKNKKIVCKFIQAELTLDNKLRNISTNSLEEKTIDKFLQNRKKFFPGIYQNFIPKKREWRVTIVGEKVFSATVYTDNQSSEDWRVYQDTDHVKFKAETLDKKYTDKLKEMLKIFNLRFGAFDLIETPEGEIVFLELNPNGQYGWLEDELGLPISEAIANELIIIANNS